MRPQHTPQSGAQPQQRRQVDDKLWFQCRLCVGWVGAHETSFLSHGRSTTIAPPAQPTQFLSANTLARAMAPSRPRSGDLAPVKFDTVDDVPCQRFSLFSCDQNHKPASQRATCASQSRIIHGVTRDKRAGGVEPFFLRVRDQSVSLAHTLHLARF